MTASGDESKVEKAQNILRSAVIGLIIALGAYGITNFVVGRIVEKTISGQQ
jgi:ABC-type molybdate transport system permease subunit